MTEKQNFDSNELHNHNCYRYLRVMADAMDPLLWAAIEKFLPSAQFSLLKAKKDYDPNDAYADLYNNFIKVVEDKLIPYFDKRIKEIHDELEAKTFIQDEWKNVIPEKTKIQHQESKQRLLDELNTYHKFVFAIYANDNHNLKLTFDAFKNVVAPEKLTKIKEHIDNVSDVNKTATMPAQAGSMTTCIRTNIASQFKPQQGTSLATIRHYRYQETRPCPIEYRFGTQGQRHDNKARVSPLFEFWLLGLKQKYAERKQPIHHIYFNNLGLVRNNSLYVDEIHEKELTHALHGLETNHSNFALITLPADKFLMQSGLYLQTTANLSYSDAFKELFAIASHEDNLTNCKHDFYISPRIKSLLFKDSMGAYSRAVEESVLHEQLTRSFLAMGITPDKKISPAQKQAVWFYFIKFELTNYIITQLDPASISFVCKDAIDRAGVASVFYNLMKSFESNHPMTREEFECGLHAAPVMVKGRSINHQINNVWNVINCYLKANHEAIVADASKKWLIQWRDENKPSKKLLTETLNEIKTLVTDYLSEEVIAGIPRESTSLMSDNLSQDANVVKEKEIIHEIVKCTEDLTYNPTRESIKTYQEFAHTIETTHPALSMLVGLMKIVAGALLAGLSFTVSAGNYCYSDLYQSGMMTFKAARNEMKEEPASPVLTIQS